MREHASFITTVNRPASDVITALVDDGWMLEVRPQVIGERRLHIARAYPSGEGGEHYVMHVRRKGEGRTEMAMTAQWDISAERRVTRSGAEGTFIAAVKRAIALQRSAPAVE